MGVLAFKLPMWPMPIVASMSATLSNNGAASPAGKALIWAAEPVAFSISTPCHSLKNHQRAFDCRSSHRGKPQPRANPGTGTPGR
jgi:hypothetical protein